jgi:7-carboxy-7-deazaguanine synthase
MGQEIENIYLKVCEMFSSIQGESSYAGLPCFFIRLSGCNLRCSFCDTAYAFDEGTDYPIAQIIDKTKKSGINLVEITGGEPLMQGNTLVLIDQLIRLGFEVLIETNGSISIKDVNIKAIIIMDIKTPSSGVTEMMNLDNINHLKPVDEVKFVISDRRDFDWSVAFIKKYQLQERCKILFSCAFGILNPETLTQWILQEKINARLNLQIHKYIFRDCDRGV